MTSTDTAVLNGGLGPTLDEAQKLKPAGRSQGKRGTAAARAKMARGEGGRFLPRPKPPPAEPGLPPLNGLHSPSQHSLLTSYTQDSSETAAPRHEGPGKANPDADPTPKLLEDHGGGRIGSETGAGPNPGQARGQEASAGPVAPLRADHQARLDLRQQQGHGAAPHPPDGGKVSGDAPDQQEGAQPASAATNKSHSNPRGWGPARCPAFTAECILSICVFQGQAQIPGKGNGVMTPSWLSKKHAQGQSRTS